MPVKLEVNANQSNTTLHAAVELEDIELVKFMINKSKNVDVQNDRSETALSLAFYCKNPTTKSTIMKILVEAGADVNTRSKDRIGKTALHAAIETGDAELVKFLVRHGSDVNAKDYEQQWTPLHYAANLNGTSKNLISPNSEVIFAVLISANADVNINDKSGFTLIESAINDSNGELLKALVRSGLNINKPSDISILHKVCMQEKVDLPTVKFLLKNGADINVSTVNNISLLQCVINMISIRHRLKYDLSKEMKLFRYLLKCNPDVNTFTANGRNILTGDRNSKILPTFLWKCIVEHLAKLHAANHPIHVNLLNTILKTPEYKNYFTKCNKELELIKNNKLSVDGRITFFNFLMDHNKNLSKYVGNKEVSKSVSSTRIAVKFPIYGAFIQERFMKAVERRLIWDQAVIRLNDLLPINLDQKHRVVIAILNYLNSKDLRKIIQ